MTDANMHKTTYITGLWSYMGLKTIITDMKNGLKYGECIIMYDTIFST